MGYTQTNRDVWLSPTPPMGFNTWNRFGGNIDQNLILETMDALVNTGLRDLGYNYLNIDDGWTASTRNTDGEFVPDPMRFPEGIAKLSARAHTLGLKLGIYSCCGTETCMGLPGSYGYEETDARTFARWGIDFLKQDWCHVPFDDFPGKSHGEVAKILYGRISHAISGTGRPMILSMCNWGDGEPWLWARGIAHLWRTTPDISDTFSTDYLNGAWDMLRIFRKNVKLDKFAGPGGWNDPDMLEVGNGGMSTTQYRSHFTLWCMMAAPLIIGTDIRSMSEETRLILSNRDLIGIDQDPLGIQAHLYLESQGVYVLVKPLVDESVAVAVFNSTNSQREMSIHWRDYFSKKINFRKDLWTGVVAPADSSTTVSILPEATLVWKVW